MPIYKITNKVTEDIYVGKTSRTLAERFYHHCYDSLNSQTHLHRAIRKYGKENFIIELLEECDDSMLDELEVKWIAELNPAYNMTKGGEGGPTHHLQSWKEGMAKRRSMKGEGNPMYGKGGMKGKVHSAETRAKMAESHRNRWNNMDDERRRARSAKLAGASNPMHGKTPSNARKIEYGGVVYNSIAEAVRLTGLSEFFLKKRGAIYG